MTMDNLTVSLDNLQKHLNLLKIVDDISFVFNDETEVILKQEGVQTKKKYIKKKLTKTEKGIEVSYIGIYEEV